VRSYAPSPVLRPVSLRSVPGTSFVYLEFGVFDSSSEFPFLPVRVDSGDPPHNMERKLSSVPKSRAHNQESSGGLDDRQQLLLRS